MPPQYNLSRNLSSIQQEIQENRVDDSYFPYWPGYVMFSTLPAPMHFHFVLDITLLFHVAPNCLTISYAHYHGGLLNGHFLSLGYHSRTVQVHLSSMNFVTCSIQLNLFSVLTHLHSWIILFKICSHNDIIPWMNLSIALYVVTRLFFSFL